MKPRVRINLAIEAALHELVRHLDPEISGFDMQKRGGISCVKGSGNYTVTLDGKPVANVAFEGKRRFTITVL